LLLETIIGVGTMDGVGMAGTATTGVGIIGVGMAGMVITGVGTIGAGITGAGMAGMATGAGTIGVGMAGTVTIGVGTTTDTMTDLTPIIEEDITIVIMLLIHQID
jgi:hypothetical protein